MQHTGELPDEVAGDVCCLGGHGEGLYWAGRVTVEKEREQVEVVVAGLVYRNIVIVVCQRQESRVRERQTR